jgi:hypothetical protein
MEESTQSNTPFTVFVETQAYSSIMCHTLKNPLTSVIGVLLGRIKENKAICSLSFSLLHSQTINSPLLGLGFSAVCFLMFFSYNFFFKGRKNRTSKQPGYYWGLFQ